MSDSTVGSRNGYLAALLSSLGGMVAGVLILAWPMWSAETEGNIGLGIAMFFAPIFFGAPAGAFLGCVLALKFKKYPYPFLTGLWLLVISVLFINISILADGFAFLAPLVPVGARALAVGLGPQRRIVNVAVIALAALMSVGISWQMQAGIDSENRSIPNERLESTPLRPGEQ